MILNYCIKSRLNLRSISSEFTCLQLQSLQFFLCLDSQASLPGSFFTKFDIVVLQPAPFPFQLLTLLLQRLIRPLHVWHSCLQLCHLLITHRLWLLFLNLWSLDLTLTNPWCRLIVPRQLDLILQIPLCITHLLNDCLHFFLHSSFLLPHQSLILVSHRLYSSLFVYLQHLLSVFELLLPLSHLLTFTL